jgi:glucosamine-6-phosphate deaminase
VSQPTPVRTFHVDRSVVEIYSSKAEVGRAGALRASAILRDAIAKEGRARLIMATGNSQEDLVSTLVQDRDIDWSRLELFHMDEYVGLPVTHRGCLRHWIITHFVDVVHPGKVEFLDGNAADLAREARRYEKLLQEAPLTLCTMGFGENGHIAFNDPHVANFQDPVNIKVVELDEPCRRQQAGEGHFPNFESVPRSAITLTCPMLMSVQNLICSVPELRKAEAVKNALEGPVSTKCPGSIVRTHPQAYIYLDVNSASLLKEESICH